jgi:histidinol-phosphate aminotransferase
VDRHLNPALSSSALSYISNTYPIDCSLGVNPFGAPPQVVKYARGYDGTHLEAYYNYQDIVALTAKISDYIHVDGESIFLGNGSFNLLTTVFFKLLRAGPKIMLGVGPQFVDAVGEWKLAGGTYTSVPLNLAGPDLLPMDALLARLALGDVMVLYLDNPNNPTGFSYPIEQLRTLAVACKRWGTILLIDEAYADFVEMGQSGSSLVKAHDHVIVVRSFSKGFGLASIRLGYAAVHVRLAERFRRITTPFRCSHFSLGAASAALDTLDHLKQSRMKTRVFKANMIELFARHGIEALPSHPDVPIFVAHRTGLNLYQTLLSQSIITEAGSCFVPTRPGFSDAYCRVRIPGSEHHFAHLSYRLQQLPELMQA